MLEEKLKLYRLSKPEYERICDLLGREPQGVEWAVFSALWSEHCSYKSSKIHLKKLFGKSERVLQSFGENAGIVDLGDGEKVAFKMESHNHPSFIEPYQGAATGVGGILRDIFTMGARPIALANYLCFGEPQAPRMSALVDGVVRGIGGYGNCVGVPNITGQTHFHESYNENILVNAMAVGYFGPEDPVCLSQIRDIGNHVVYVGAKTGRDGIHGASMASESFDDDSASKRPTVQIGDPFFEKLLIEACLEVMKKDLVTAIQDMGAAGLTSSSFEMAEKGGLGIEMDLGKVPLRDSTLTPEDVLLSESQERMLLTCHPEKFIELEKVFERWGLDARIIGKVIEEPKVKLLWHGEVLTEMDPQMVVSNAPQYDRPFDKYESEYGEQFPKPKQEGDVQKMFKEVMTSVHGGSRHWIYDQYDQRVGANTARDCSEAVGVVRLPKNGKAIAVALGCRPHLMRQDAYWGGRDSIIHPALQMALQGFEPLAVTDCLNFGNPEKTETMTQFVAALNGMNQICQSLVTPIISGNVSFYNETKNKNVTPTPSTGLVGLRPHLEDLPHSYFTKEDQTIYAITWSEAWTSGFLSELKKEKVSGYLPEKIEGLSDFVKMTTELGRNGLISCGRVVSKFGPLYTLARMSLKGVGAEIDSDQAYFVEPLYQMIVTTSQAEQLEAFLKKQLVAQLEWKKIGQTQKNTLKWNEFNLSTKEIADLYEQSWEKNFETLA